MEKVKENHLKIKYRPVYMLLKFVRYDLF